MVSDYTDTNNRGDTSAVPAFGGQGGDGEGDWVEVGIWASSVLTYSVKHSAIAVSPGPFVSKRDLMVKLKVINKFPRIVN